MRTSRTRNAVAAVLVGAALAAVSPAMAQAQAPQSGDPIPSRIAETNGIMNVKSGKFLQPTSSANGAKVVQRSANDSLLQRWDTVLTEAGTWYTFENYGAGRNLGIDGASESNGAAAIIANGSSDLNQDWKLVFGGGGDYFTLKNRKSGKCLGISGGSTANGAQAAQFTCDGNTNQRWTWTR
ncbi:RICIN domain-containing protein [Streptomyces xinghaiensis]|uniref:RICIN domain-containing protein n=1 Tax=Streptomyces xinghaiensis TaxID=1038928 RepID=UPI002E153E96|nr:RICIN domain-containing protein [Streptomyces xinghaiensis]